MRAFHMPSLGDTLVLAADWTFTVVNDSRNRLLIDWAGLASVPSNVYSYFPLGTGQYDVTRNWHELRATTRAVTLPKGTVLTIDRIYLRKGSKEYDSVTFRGAIPGAKRKVRFFARLADVNRIVMEDAHE